jgi:acetyl-CoA carboxylase biotin carboxyl carrier protein
MATRKPSIDQDLIRDLANILNETDLTEIEIEQDDLRVRVSRAGTPQTIHAPIAQAPAPQAPAPVAAAEAAPAAPSANAVTAPMVGTVYLSPAPDAKPFVEVGQTVKEGQTILDHRSHEDHEPDPLAAQRQGDQCSGQRRPSGGIRRTDDRDRVSEWAHVRQGSDCQSRRDRTAHPARLQGTGHRHCCSAFHRRQRRHACAACR